MKKILLFSLLVFMPSLASAYSAYIDGIYYNLNYETKDAEVTEGENQYFGDVALPSSVSYYSIEFNVSSVGNRAFYYCTGLTSVTIPNSVTIIGSEAFYECTGLTSVIIPNSVTSIGDWAFYYCTGLTSVTIPNSVTSIGSDAFCNCRNLTSVMISNSVTEIGPEAFGGCSNLASVLIPNSVTKIGTSAFAACSSLTSIKVESDNTYYDSRNNCNAIIETASNTLITGCNTTIIPNDVVAIGDSAFLVCTGLTSVTIPNSVTSIGESAFYGCTGLTSIEIPLSVNKIEERTFQYCSNLTFISIPNSVTSIGLCAFGGCESLTAIFIPNSVTEIGEMAFALCTGLISISIPNSVTEIRELAFALCTGLTSINIPDSITVIKPGTFGYCTSLTSIYIPNSVTIIGQEAFAYCTSLTTIDIPNSLTEIGSAAFGDCTSLTSISIPNSVTEIGELAFAACSSLTSIKVEADNTYYDSRNNCNAIIETASNTLITGCNTTVIPNDVVAIGEGAFYGCTGLTSVIIPNSVTSIGDRAFYECTGLTTIISFIDNIFDIDDNVFYADNDMARIKSPLLNTLHRNTESLNFDNLINLKNSIEETLDIRKVISNAKNNKEDDSGSVIYDNALLYVPLGTAEIYRNTEGWKNFKNIIENGFNIIKTHLTRETNHIHVCVYFSNIPHKYASLEGLIGLSSKDENLQLLSFSISEKTCDLYFSLPKKEGSYTLKIEHSFKNANGGYLDQNLNGITNEEEDTYIEDFIFGNNELYIVAQSPSTGVVDKEGYTDIVFNDPIQNIPLSSVSMFSPSGKEIRIKSVEHLEAPSPARHRISYDKLGEDGIYSITIRKGLISDNGKEMRYDQQLYIELPCADLQPISLTPLDSHWISGQKQSITYTLRNVGTNVANGPSVDILYLSTNEEWSGDAIEIYRDTTNIDLDPEKDLSKTIEVTVPPCIDGLYYLILKTNVVHTFNELSFNDNTISSDSLNLSVDWLSDTNYKFTLGRGESRLFKVLVDVDKNIEVIDKNGTANLFSGCGYYPNTDENPKNGSVAILGSHHFPMTYYLLVLNNWKNQTINQQCDLNIREFELDFTSVEKTEIVKYKKAWIPIEMIGCTEMPVFHLVDSYGTKTECTNVFAKTETSFYAQFDTEPLQVGNYNLYAECAGKTGMLQNAVTIKQEVANPKIEAKLILPGTSRIGSTITAYIDYKNVGNVDIPAPLFVITGTEGSEFAVDGYDDFSDECHVYGMNENGVLSALLPGESNRIAVQIKIPNEHIYTADYKLKTITEGCDGMDEHFYLQWLDVDPDENPGCYTDEEWNEYCNRLRRNVGENWHTFIQAMATVTDLCFTSYFAVHDATYLYDILKGYNIAEISALMTEEKAKRKNAPANQEYDEPGTIYLYYPSATNPDPWMPLIEYVDNNIWKPIGYVCQLINKEAKTIFIAHGMNNTHKQEWIEAMASELHVKEPNANIICVDWGKCAYGTGGMTGILPFDAANDIDPVVWRLNEALKTAFSYEVDLSKFHFIGHSHGAHVCARLIALYATQPYRLTCLDMSEELDHMGSKGVNIYHKGSLVVRFNAKNIDYYKSSIICGSEWLVGDDNFILAMDNNGFSKPVGVDYILNDGPRHGYAYEWFTATINNNWGVGYNWDFNNNPKIAENRKMDGLNSGKRWSGVINGKGSYIKLLSRDTKNKSIIENYTNFKDKDDKNWNYPEPWYEKDNKDKNKPSEWKFRDAFATTIDYFPTEIMINKEYIQAGTIESLQVSLFNYADNLSISLHDRQSETRNNVCNVLYISNTDVDDMFPGYVLPHCNGNISNLHTSFPLYYLGESDDYIKPKENDISTNVDFNFNISKELWDLLGGKDEKEIDCYLWLVSSVDRSEKYYKESPRFSVQLWQGELRPQDNVLCKRVKVKKPDLSCDAGADRTITLQKNQDKVDVNVAGTVVNEGDYELSYAWKEGNSEFSAAMVGTASLGVGTHTLTFEVEASDASFAKARRAPFTSKDTICDDVIITVKPYTPGDEDDESTETASSWDPNEKVGIRGAGGRSCIRQGETMEYTIYFENDAEKAQLAAQTVTVIDTLDAAFDLTTFEFTGAEASNTYIDVPLGKSETTILTDMRPDNDLILKTEMKLDIDKRIVKVVYSSLDTLTYEPTLDVFAGFLPPNDFTHRGEGHFSYRVKLKDDVADGYVVKNQAHIFFDFNDEIATNITHHPVDNRAPISTVDGLPNETREDSIMVSWSGYDQGSGIRYYDIYRSKNGGNYELWKSHTSDVSAIQYGVKNDIYKYFSVATDSLGFVEEMKTSPEATVKFIGSSDGITLVENDPKIDVIYQNEAFIVTGAEGSMFNVYDLLGQIVVSKQLTYHYERIPFDRKGVYLVSVDNRVGVLFEKKLVTK